MKNRKYACHSHTQGLRQLNLLLFSATLCFSSLALELELKSDAYCIIQDALKDRPGIMWGESYRLSQNINLSYSILNALDRYTENNRESILSPQPPLIRFTMYTVYSAVYCIMCSVFYSFT